MGRIGKNKTLVSISIPTEWRDEIDRRAAALSLTRAAYVTMILEPVSYTHLTRTSAASWPGRGVPVDGTHQHHRRDKTSSTRNKPSNRHRLRFGIQAGTKNRRREEVPTR